MSNISFITLPWMSRGGNSPGAAVGSRHVHDMVLEFGSAGKLRVMFFIDLTTSFRW